MEEINYVICHWRSNGKYKIRVENIRINDIPYSCTCNTKEEFNAALKSLQKEYTPCKVVELVL